MIFGILTEDNALNGPSNKTELDAWITSEGAPNTWTHETVPTLQAGIEGYFMSGRETYFVVDLSTMTIVSKFFAAEPQALADLESRLP